MDNLLKLLSTMPQPGQIVEIGDKAYIYAYWDGAAPAAITQGLPVVIGMDVSGTSTNNPIVIAPATLATVLRQVAIAPQALSAAGWYWWQIKGPCLASVDGDTVDVAIGNYLEVLNAGTGLTANAANPTTRDVTHCAVACEANAGAAALKWVYLLGDKCTVAAA